MMVELMQPTIKDIISDPAMGFRVIIVIEANSYVNIRSSRLLPKFKTQKINSWCAA
ncbi:restriction endonuclease subunit M [Streptococcus pneumoniae]